jgi:DNA-binding GntR family transcriptional regulator
MSVENVSSRQSNQRENAVSSIELAIATAALIPGRIYTKDSVAALSGESGRDIDGALAVLEAGGYLTLAGQDVTICPLN